VDEAIVPPVSLLWAFCNRNMSEDYSLQQLVADVSKANDGIANSLLKLLRDCVTILADARWCGQHGIGRFATEVLVRLGDYASVPRTLPLLHPLEPFWLSHVIGRFKPSIYFSPGFNPPAHSDCPLVFVVHDLIHLKVAAESNCIKRLYYERVVRPAVKHASRVLTVSEFSRQDLVQWAGVASDRVCVVGNGISAAFRKDGPIYQNCQPYFLFVGARKPHKNLGRIMLAFARSGLADHIRLLITGPAGRQLMKAASELGISSSVQFIGILPDSDLAAAYRGAVALLAPSLYEGFCLPALEAMACGCPVVAANTEVQREVIGDGGLFVDPLRVDDIASAMLTVLQSADRERLIAHGLRRSLGYSWDRTAAKVSSALDEGQQHGRRRAYAAALA
jgi:O-antigen biosynthesis alpha-1,2-mannosyltransferase